MLKKGDPLSKELRFRLRGYTTLFVTLFLVGHISAYEMTRRYVCRCEDFPVPVLNANTVQMILYAVIALLYLAGWIEVIRMLYVRWWPHWGTLASEASLDEARRTAFPAHLWVLTVLAVAAFFVIFGCQEFQSGVHLSYGWHTSVFSGLLGSFVGSYGAWFIRVEEPFLPLS